MKKIGRGLRCAFVKWQWWQSKSETERREKREGEDRGVKYWEDLRGSSNLFLGCMQGSSEVL